MLGEGEETVLADAGSFGEEHRVFQRQQQTFDIHPRMQRPYHLRDRYVVVGHSLHRRVKQQAAYGHSLCRASMVSTEALPILCLRKYCGDEGLN